jgi:ABC-type multidrug transport system ATPase subunit
LATLLLPAGGSVEVAGCALPERAAQARFHIGYLPQEFGLFPRLSCGECLDYLALLKGIDERGKRRAEVEAALAAVHLSEMRNRRVAALSGGMRRRLGIAQTLLAAPEVLILDEPTAGLDPEERTRLWNVLGDIAAARTVLLSTHNVADVAALCPQVAVLDGGRVRFSGSPAELATRAAGHVFELRLSREEYERRPAAWTIAGTRAERDGMVIRVLADARPESWAANPVEATTEDGYLSLMAQAVPPEAADA